MAAKRRVLATIVASGLLTLMTSAAHAAPATSEGAPLDETAATSPREIPARYDPLIGTLDRAAEDHRDVFGGVWFDHDRSVVVVDILNMEARGVADLALADAGLPDAGSTVEYRVVVHNRDSLDRLANDAIGLPGVVETYVDDRSNGVVAVAADNPSAARARASGELDSAVRLVVDPSIDSGDPADRMADTSPFYGGARTITPSGNGCSDAFSWRNGSTYTMVTAGHCVPNGGTTKNGGGSAMGTTASGTRENWAPGFGTAWLTGDNQYRGDIALISLSSPKTNSPRVYRGSTTSATSSAVAEIWSRSPRAGDQFCTGGTRSGELCGWVVQETNVVHEYSNGEILRSGFRATRAGSCIIGGDSGGPAFTVRSDGRLAAKGVVSGSNSSSTNCNAWFTDIWHVVYAYGGNLALG